MAEKLEILIGAKDQFSSTFTKLKGALAGVVATYAGFKGLQAFADTMKSIAEEADRFSKLSDRLGYTTEMLSKMNYAANISGIEFESLAKSMQFVLRNTGEAARGNEQMVDTINELGLSLSKLKGMKPDELFMTYAKAVASVENPALRASYAMEVFGRGGGTMLQMLRGGEEGIEKLTAEAERFGIVISNQAAVNGAEYNDSLERMSAATRGLRNALFSDLLPYFTATFNRIAFFIADNRGLLVSWAGTAVDVFGAVAKAGLYAAAGITDAWTGIKLIFHGLVYSVADLALSMRNIWTREIRFILDSMIWLNDVFAASQLHGWLDEPIMKMRAFIGETHLGTAELLRFQSSVLEKMNELTEDGLSIEKVSAFISSIREELARLNTEGTGKILPPQVGEMATLPTDKIKSEIEALKKAWQEYYLSESAQADAWYKEQQQKFAGHKEALLILEQLYLGKKYEAVRAEMELDAQKYEESKTRQDQLFQLFETEILKKQEQLQLWYEQQLAMAAEHEEEKALIELLYAERLKELKAQQLQEQLDIYADFLGGMAAIAGAMGRKAFMLEKALNIGQAIMSTYAGAARAMKDHPYPYNMIAAAAVIAFGLAQVAKIAQQKPPEAKTGVDFVPADQTYKLHRGERVVPAETNKDLKAFLSGGGAGGGVQIGAVEFSFPNVRSAEDLRSMSDREWQDVIEEKMIPNLRRLAGAGITL